MRKLPYFESECSIVSCISDMQSQLTAIADRYQGANPPTTFKVRAVSTDQFKQDEGGNWMLDLTDKFDNSTEGYALICGMFISEIAKLIDISISC